MKVTSTSNLGVRTMGFFLLNFLNVIYTGGLMGNYIVVLPITVTCVFHHLFFSDTLPESIKVERRLLVLGASLGRYSLYLLQFICGAIYSNTPPRW